MGRVATAVVALCLFVTACGRQGDGVTDTDSGGATDPPTTTTEPTDERTDDAGGTSPARSVDDIPVAHTPDGGWHGTMPPPVLAGCTEPPVAGAPDLGGLWQIGEVEVDGVVTTGHPAMSKVQRIEQCGDRLVVTAGGVVHDMRVDGTEANGVHDVAEIDYATPITVVATYEDGVHVLRPVGLPIEVTRQRDGDQLVWTYLTFTARLDRIGPADADPGSGITALESAPQPTIQEAD